MHFSGTAQAVGGRSAQMALLINLAKITGNRIHVMKCTCKTSNKRSSYCTERDSKNSKFSRENGGENKKRKFWKFVG